MELAVYEYTEIEKKQSKPHKAQKAPKKHISQL
jgi:hypothetical protein